MLIAAVLVAADSVLAGVVAVLKLFGFGKMLNVWESRVLQEAQKIALYERGVLSVLLYGCEAWILDDRLQRMLRGWNSRCLHAQDNWQGVQGGVRGAVDGHHCEGPRQEAQVPRPCAAPGRQLAAG